MKSKLTVVLALLLPAFAMAQELKCNVTVISPQVQNTEKRIFETLQNDIREFMNSRRWTMDQFTQDERIECSILITVSERISNDQFKATMQVQASRPAFKTAYNSTLINVNDQDFTFKYLENEPIQWQENQHLSQLSSTLAFYAYMILGYDYDSFAPKGGEPHFQKALQIVSNAQTEPERGWKAFEGSSNRYWLVENMMNPRFDRFRNIFYQYHRMGLDVMSSDINKGRNVIFEQLEPLRLLKRDQPNSFLLQVFFSSKSDEMVNIFSGAMDDQKSRAVNELSQMDPGNAQKYQRIMRN